MQINFYPSAFLSSKLKAIHKTSYSNSHYLLSLDATVLHLLDAYLQRLTIALHKSPISLRCGFYDLWYETFIIFQCRTAPR